MPVNELGRNRTPTDRKSMKAKLSPGPGSSLRGTLLLTPVSENTSNSPTSAPLLIYCRLGPGLPLFFFQAEDGIRDVAVTGVQTCALPISQTAAGVDFSEDYSRLQGYVPEADLG